MATKPKVTIIYATRKGATRKIVDHIARIFDNVEIYDLSKEKPEKLGDLIIIGSPIYLDKPLPEVLKFLEENPLENKLVAIFILSLADIFSKLGKNAEKTYLKYFEERIKGKIISKKVFRGWIIKENKNSIKEAEKWGKELYSILSGYIDIQQNANNNK